MCVCNLGNGKGKKDQFWKFCMKSDYTSQEQVSDPVKVNKIPIFHHEHPQMKGQSDR